MKTVKSLLLGSAAGFVAFTGAQAADLPMAEPVEYVKVCSTYGDGFFYIPGTDTCLDVGGYLRFDQRFDFGEEEDDDDFAGSPLNDGYSSKARASIRLDARTETEWGTLRSYIEVHVEDGYRDDSDVYLENGFIQFAGFTAGRASSFYDFVVTDTYADFFSDQQVNTFVYTASFGSGFSATIGIEDKNDRAVYWLDDQVQSSDFPNGIAALRVDQAWGAAQLSAAVQDNEGDDLAYGPLFIDGGDLGFAVQLGIQYNVAAFGEDSYVWAQGTYSDGAVGYGFLGNGIHTGAFEDITDYDPITGDNNELWAIGGGFSAGVTDAVTLGVSAAYIEYNGTFGGVSDDREIIQVAGRLLWEPVDGLALGPELEYTTADFDALDEDFDDLRLQTRIQRNF